MNKLLLAHPFVRELVISTLIGLGVYAVCVAIVLAAELAQRHDMRVYRTRNAWNDLAYAVFYKCSIYNVLAFPLFALIVPRLSFLKLHPLERLPAVATAIACWVAFDLLRYWIHRLQHLMPLLWAFHSVHHSQTQLTFLSANRIHAFEQLYMGLLMMIPALLLGVPQRLWLPLLAVQLFSETVQHARLTWSYGILGRIFISPAGHAVHHSSRESDFNANYAHVFSLWDVVFGTFVDGSEPPRSFGIDGMPVPERLTAQFFHPFRLLRRTGAA